MECLPELTMRFCSDELCDTEFFHPILPKRRIAVRGKTAGAMQGAGTFQWTSAVQALAVLLLRTVIQNSSPGKVAARLSGERGSLAISLDYAISKQVNWIQDMFGIDSKGQLIVRRIFLRSNANCKMPGPVRIALNDKFLHPSRIMIEIDGDSTPNPDRILSLAEGIGRQFEGTRLTSLRTRDFSEEIVLPLAS